MKLATLFILILLQSNSVMSQQETYFKKALERKGGDFVHTAAISVTDTIIIQASIEKVWLVIDDTPNYINWFPGLKSAKFVEADKTGLGAKRLAHAQSFKYYEEIIAYVPMKKWGFTILESNSSIFKSVVEVLTLEKVGENQTKVIYQGGYEPSGLYKLMKKTIGKSTVKAWSKGLQSMKSYIEERVI